MVFLGRNHDILHVLADGYERTRFDVVESSIFDKVLYCFAGAGETLDLVEYYDAIAGNKLSVVCGAKVEEEGVKVVKVFLEIPLYLARSRGEIDKKVCGVFVFGEFFSDVALPDATRTVKHDGGFAVAGLLPFQQSVVYLAFHGCSSCKTCVLYHATHGHVKSRMVDFKGFDRSKSTRFQRIRKAEIYTFSNDSHYEALD